MHVGPQTTQQTLPNSGANPTIRIQTVPSVSRFTGPPLALRKTIVTQQPVKTKANITKIIPKLINCSNEINNLIVLTLCSIVKFSYYFDVYCVFYSIIEPFLIPYIPYGVSSCFVIRKTKKKPTTVFCFGINLHKNFNWKFISSPKTKTRNNLIVFARKKKKNSDFHIWHIKRTFKLDSNLIGITNTKLKIEKKQNSHWKQHTAVYEMHDSIICIQLQLSISYRKKK